MTKSRKELAKKCNELRMAGRRLVFTNGCFDILHRGHVAYLEEAKNMGDILIIGLNSDDSVRRLKGPGRPLNTASDRAFVLNALKSVDYVTIFDEDTPYDLIKALKPDVLVKGGDYKTDDIVGADIVRESGGEVHVIPLVLGKSTTSLIEKIKNQPD